MHKALALEVTLGPLQYKCFIAEGHGSDYSPPRRALEEFDLVISNGVIWKNKTLANPNQILNAYRGIKNNGYDIK